MTGLLASVADLAEAQIALAHGCDLIDLKDPAKGALGAWELADIAAALPHLKGKRPISAVLGDLPMEPSVLVAAASAMAGTGVDLVKVGFFACEDPTPSIEALGAVAGEGARLIAVMMADQDPDLALVPAFAQAGFAGVMLDTAAKGSGGLLAHQPVLALRRFVQDVQGHRMLCGLAGSLRLGDVAPLSALGPDYLGFRTALCPGGRTAGLSGAAIEELQRELRAVPVA